MESSVRKEQGHGHVVFIYVIYQSLFGFQYLCFCELWCGGWQSIVGALVVNFINVAMG